VVALVSSGSRIVATPALRIESARRAGGQIELFIAGDGFDALEDAVLFDGARSRELARLGQGLQPVSAGLQASFAAAGFEGGEVELDWVSAGIERTATLSVPDLRARAAVLHPPHPNPFNPSARLEVELTEGGPARLRIFDLRGRVVRVLHSGPLDAGLTAFAFDGRDDRGRSLASGSYLAVLEAAGLRSVQRLTLVE
jgi:hypothetical protein